MGSNTNQILDATVGRLSRRLGSIDLHKQDLSKPGRENWVADADVVACAKCTKPFGWHMQIGGKLLVRKHHCRACGQIFCSDCTKFRIEVNRSHYAEDIEKGRRVCTDCYANKIDEKESREFISLFKVPVIAVESENDSQGRRFFFAPEDWNQLLNVESSSKWNGKSFHVMQFRNCEQVWCGNVTVKRAGESCFGFRTRGEAFDQWQVDDIIFLGGEETLRSWHETEAIKLSSRADAFDGHIVHVQSEDISSAVKQLNGNNLSCPEGICIVHCQNPRENYLCARRDQKRQGERIMESYNALQALGNQRSVAASRTA